MILDQLQSRIRPFPHRIQRETSYRSLYRRVRTRSKKSRRQFANDFSILNPTIWASEAIVQLLPNMVMANLVARDFETLPARFGDIVNAFVPGQFTMTKKGALCDQVVIQDASGSAVQVALDQWPQVSFMICDGEENRDQIDLIDTLLTPAVIALATGIDRIISSQVYRFIPNYAGHLNLLDPTNVQAYLLEARESMNRLNVPLPNRNMILTPGTETQALEVGQFTKANEAGDQGTALTEATLGRKYGWNLYMTQTQPEVAPGQTTIGVVTMNAAAAAGATTVVLTGAAAASVAVGQWLSIAGDDLPHQVATVTGAGPYTATLVSPLKRAVAGAAAVTIIAGGAVNNVAGYNGTSTSPRVMGWNKDIDVDGFPANSLPQVGQLVTFGTDTVNRYTITKVTGISTTEANIELDRPLVSAITNNTIVNLGPSGKYNFGFLQNALAMVSRPLPQPRAGTGALSRVINDPVNKLSIRVTITYDGEKQGHLVTLDLLMGIGVLNNKMGVIMAG